MEVLKMKVPKEIMNRRLAKSRAVERTSAFGIKEVKDGWVVVEVIVGNGKYLTKPGPKVLAMEKCKYLQAKDWWK